MSPQKDSNSHHLVLLALSNIVIKREPNEGNITENKEQPISDKFMVLRKLGNMSTFNLMGHQHIFLAQLVTS